MKTKLKLSFNYLYEFEELLKNKELDIDFFKLPPFPDLNDDYITLQRAVKVKPVLFHGVGVSPGDLCDSGLKNIVNVDRMNKMFSLCSNEYISTHIHTKRANCMSKEELFNTAVDNIEWLKSTFKLPIALENEPARPGFDISNTVTEPEFIYRLVKETKSMFLLDIAHAKVDAYYRNMKLDEYLKELPLEDVCEIHISGTGFSPDGEFIDTHQEADAEDYGILKELLPKTACKMITFEFSPTPGRTDVKQQIINQYMKISELL